MPAAGRYSFNRTRGKRRGQSYNAWLSIEVDVQGQSPLHVSARGRSIDLNGGFELTSHRSLTKAFLPSLG